MSPFYIWHQTVLVVLGVWIVRWDVGVGARFVALALVTFAVTLGICEFVARTRLTRIAFGMRPRPGV